ncbi:MAG TPA: hypothetical protein VM286_09415 [Candidatus Thermoplasmatota archaeon]|nr:hypothetical protein [Candidatus Thermoplasmatota archaeon]
MMRVLPLALVALLMAGCFAPNDNDSTGDATATDDAVVPGTAASGSTDTSWVARALGNHGGDDDAFKVHRDWTKHVGLSTPNLLELGHNPLGIYAFENRTAGGYFCGGEGISTDGKHISVISSFDTNIAFVVVDTTDPMNPKHLGDYLLDFAQTYDVDITPDAKHVVVAADVDTKRQPPPGGLAPDGPAMVTLHPAFRNACTGKVTYGPDQYVAAGPSTILVSLADPTNPTFEDLVPSPVLGPHSVSTAIVDGHTYIASSITNLVHQASYFQFFEVLTLPTGTGKLVQLSVFDAAAAGSTAAVNGHVDAEISKHPVTGKAVVYLSNWDGGLIVLDFSVPQAPRVLSTWADSGADGGQMHSTRSIEGVHDGRHYLLAGQEFIGHPANRPSGWVYILDDTDPAKVTEVGRWTLPVDVEQEWHGVELYSTHYFRVLDNTAFVAMYHGGLWAFKLDFEHPENMALPKTVGVFMPDQNGQNGRDPTGTYDFAPFVLDVFPYPDGTLVVYDGLSGVYTVKYDEKKDMPSPEPWPKEGKKLS